MDTTFDPQAYLASKAAALPTSLGEEDPKTPVDPLQVQQFDPASYIRKKELGDYNTLQSEYGTLPQQALAGAEAFGRGATLGGSDVLATQLGFTTPEAMSKRQEANPLTALSGSSLGSGALIGVTGGLAAPIEAGLGAGVAARALGYGAEGALFGAGNVVSDAALGDPHLNAQKILAEIGMGAAIGGGIGVLSKAIGQAPALLRKAKESFSPIEGGGASPVVDVLGKKPSSLEQMDKMVQDGIKYGGQENLLELPQKAEAVDAASRMNQEMQFPMTDMQLDSLNSQDARNELKTILEVPGKNGETLRNYQGAQKQNLIRILDHTIDDISPGYKPTTDAAEAGERAAESFTQQIEKTRKDLAPAFKEIKSTPLENTPHLPGVIEYLTDTQASPYANPKLANMFDTSANKVEIKPYTTAMGMDHSTYRAIKQVVTSLEDNPKDFEKLFDIRKGLTQNIDISKLGDAAKEIGSAKAAMMDYIQDAVQKVNPSAQVRDTFKKWAINEENAQLIERKFGAEIGSTNWRSLAKGKAEEGILKKIFRDSETVAAVKNILPEAQFKQLLADHLAILRNDVTDKGVFSSNKFFSQLRKNQYALGEAFGGTPDTYQKIKDSLTLLRIFADDVPHNPSGTTKTLLQALMTGGVDPFKHISEIFDYGKGKYSEIKQAAEINHKLAHTADQTKKLSLIDTMLKRVNTQMDKATQAIFSDRGKNIMRGVALGSSTRLSDQEYNQHISQLKKFSMNPDQMMDHLADNTTHMYHAAPQITQNLHQSVMQGIQFLKSKLPQAPNQFPLSPEWKPSQAQKTQFNEYYNAVNKPIEVLKQIKNGSLSHATMEALQTVHPQLLQEMRSKVLEHLNPEKGKSLPYSQKIALSKFLGQPMESTLLPQVILSNQQSFNMNLSQQSTRKQGRVTQGGLQHLNLSGLVETKTQAKDED